RDETLMKPAPTQSNDSSTTLRPRLRVFLWRALRLRCPECGISPMFVPLRRTRSIRDWFEPLDGCPRCGYAYEREPGYFLLAIWGSQYGVVAGFGITLGL